MASSRNGRPGGAPGGTGGRVCYILVLEPRGLSDVSFLPPSFWPPRHMSVRELLCLFKFSLTLTPRHGYCSTEQGSTGSARGSRRESSTAKMASPGAAPIAAEEVRLHMFVVVAPGLTGAFRFPFPLPLLSALEFPPSPVMRFLYRTHASPFRVDQSPVCATAPDWQGVRPAGG